MRINDIDGTKAKPRFIKNRNIDPYTHVEGSSPKEQYVRIDGFDNLKVKDINNAGIFFTSRNTNPLNPVYTGVD